MSDFIIKDPEFIDLKKTSVRFTLIKGYSTVVAELKVPANQEKGINPHWDYILENFDIEQMRKKRNDDEVRIRKIEEYKRQKREAQQENDALIRLFNKKMSLFEIPFISESNDDIRSAIRRSGDDLFLDFLYFDILKKIMIENNYTYVELLDYLEKVKDEKIESK